MTVAVECDVKPFAMYAMLLPVKQMQRGRAIPHFIAQALPLTLPGWTGSTQTGRSCTPMQQTDTQHALPTLLPPEVEKDLRVATSSHMFSITIWYNGALWLTCIVIWYRSPFVGLSLQYGIRAHFHDSHRDMI